MKKLAFLISLFAVGILFSGCGTKSQTITLKDGQKIITHDEVDYNSDTGFYSYENKDGTTSRINKSDILSIDDN